jgi:hypothetical protein
MISRRWLFLLVMVTILALTGSQCVFVATSGNNSCKSSNNNPCDSKQNHNSGTVVVVNTGQLIDAPVQGVRYEAGSVSGITGALGEFRYEEGSTIRFYIGDIALGNAVKGKAIITPLDLIPGGTTDTPAVVNIARLLQSLDATPGDHVINIPAALRSAALRSNASVSTSIQYLDFADETTFVNTATQLISTLTASYPFTVVLVDASSAREQLVRTLDEMGTVTGR